VVARAPAAPAGKDGAAGETWAVVPAGGRGVRMGRKKQDIGIGGRPVLRWTLDRLAAARSVHGVVVVVPPEDVRAWRRRLRACRKVRAVVAGGTERQVSVAHGLAAVPGGARWILVHDGVRPCVTPALVDRVAAAARAHGAAVAALPVAETLKRGAGGRVRETVPRDGLWAVQTPQGFRAALLRDAHRRAAADGVLGTDDAALVERLGAPVWLVPGLPANVKITRPEDLPLARLLLIRAGRAGPRRPGRGARR
jgi:2-C-methyl-D-erythritol 4-phosphate cytidylyltransferase